MRFSSLLALLCSLSRFIQYSWNTVLPDFYQWWVLLIFYLEFEKIISGSAYTRSRNENIFLWIWIISACASLAESRIQILPDLFFLLLLITHMEQRWGKGGVPASHCCPEWNVFCSGMVILLYTAIHSILDSFKWGQKLPMCA